MPPIRQRPKTMFITEEMMREIFKCPRGFVIQRVCCHEAYEIQSDGIVRNLFEDCDYMPYVDFIDLMNTQEFFIIRVHEQVEEMTLDEVCKALGKTIKIVRG